MSATGWLVDMVKLVAVDEPRSMGALGAMDVTGATGGDVATGGATTAAAGAGWR